MPADRSPVPAWLQGCWRRASIEFADGTSDADEVVHWLQTGSAMADVRTTGHRPSFTGVRSFAQCAPAHLAALATSNASTGFTTVTDVVDLADGGHTCTARWHTYGHGANFQPVCGFPEPGELRVSADGHVMIERAPSGAYVEEWRLVPGSRDVPPRRIELDDGELFVAGPIAIVVRDRRPAVPRPAPLTELLDDIRAAGHLDAAAVGALLDGEFSVAVRHDDGVHRIEWSTLPWREGAIVDVAA